MEKESLKKRLLQLLQVKSIVTLMLVTVACYGFVVKIIPVELFATWVGATIAYFFNRKQSD